METVISIWDPNPREFCPWLLQVSMLKGELETISFLFTAIFTAAENLDLMSCLSHKIFSFKYELL